MNLKISVVVPVKDRFALAQICLDSILNQDRLIDELIVVDDGSISPASVFFRETQLRAARSGIELRFVRNEVNKGVSASRNIGFKSSTGNIVSFCDSDDFWIPQKTTYVLEAFKDKNIAIHFHAFGWCCDTLRAFKLMPKNRTLKLPRFVLVMFAVLSPSCMSVRREAFGAGYSEDMRYHEDLDYAFKVSQRHEIYFFNYPFTVLGRSPASEGGETVNKRKMREGAVEALRRVEGSSFIILLAKAKIIFHKIKLLRLR